MWWPPLFITVSVARRHLGGYTAADHRGFQPLMKGPLMKGGKLLLGDDIVPSATGAAAGSTSLQLQPFLRQPLASFLFNTNPRHVLRQHRWLLLLFFLLFLLLWSFFFCLCLVNRRSPAG